MAGTRNDQLGGVGRRLTKIYIAGKITGDEGYRAKFRRAAETVRGMEAGTVLVKASNFMHFDRVVKAVLEALSDAAVSE